MRLIQFLLLRSRQVVLMRSFAIACAVAGLPVHAQSFLTAPANPLVPSPQSEGEKIDQLLRAGQRDEALRRTELLVAQEPRNAQARFLRGVILGDLGRITDAVSVFESLTQEYPELPEPFNNLAVLLASQGKLDVARSMLEQALRLQPSYITAHENLGDLNVALAADAYRRATALDPANAVLKSKLALARDASSRLKSAR